MDASMLAVGKAGESTLFGRKAAREEGTGSSDDDSVAEEHADDKLAASIRDLSDDAVTRKMIQHLADTALPASRKLSLDPDRMTAICTNAVYYIVAPALKTKSRCGRAGLSATAFLVRS